MPHKLMDTKIQQIIKEEQGDSEVTTCRFGTANLRTQLDKAGWNQRRRFRASEGRDHIAILPMPVTNWTSLSKPSPNRMRR